MHIGFQQIQFCTYPLLENIWEEHFKKLDAKEHQSQPNNPSLKDETDYLNDIMSPDMVKKLITNL